ncbi:MAG: Vitamin B12 dependent methionine synthase activation subunit, partial [Clostridiales bacterium]|nr:Vitamin B12 dependent methionine synthase activation subunit [Clostridiales bacterium]
DVLCNTWRKEFTGSFLRPRFSPGYGDLPLEIQGPLLESLDAKQLIGVTLTNAYLMLPQKSVSAFVGIGKTGCIHPEQDCQACNKTNCEFRL